MGILVTMAPMYDGFKSIFFRKVRHLIREDMYAAILAFFKSNYTVKVVNYTFITLVWKSLHASSITQFRQIFCMLQYNGL